MPDNCRQQCHFWLAPEDHQFLRELAEMEGLPVGGLLRRMVRRMRLAQPGTPYQAAPSRRTLPEPSTGGGEGQ